MRNLALFALLLFAGNALAQHSPEEWRADIDFLAKTLPARHPGYATSPFAERFQQDLSALSQNLSGRSDLDIALDIQTILSKPGDAHTRLDLTGLLQQDKTIPIGMGWYAEGLYVSATVKKFQAVLGKRVVKINGLDTEEALQKVGRFVAQENEFCLRKEALQWFRFPAAFRKAGVSTTDTLVLTYEVQAGKTQTIRVYPLDVNNRADMQSAQFQPKDPDLRWQPLEYLFYMKWLPADSVLYVQYNRCMSQEMSLAAGDSARAMQLPPFQPFADSILAFMEHHPNAKLFFDLRFNNGGGASDGVGFANRIAGIPSINRKERLFIAVNLYTFSSAVQIAAGFDELTNATLVGDPPAERPNHYGEVRAFTLPISGITVAHSTRFMKVTKGNAKALYPDQLIEQPFDQFKNGKDPVLDYVRKAKI